jgi:hypothetical protein
MSRPLHSLFPHPGKLWASSYIIFKTRSIVPLPDRALDSSLDYVHLCLLLSLGKRLEKGGVKVGPESLGSIPSSLETPAQVLPRG